MTKPPSPHDRDNKAREFWIETHELVKGRKNISGHQAWPQVYEAEMKDCIHVREITTKDEAKDEALESAKANIINLMNEIRVLTGTRLNKGARRDAQEWLKKYGDLEWTRDE